MERTNQKGFFGGSHRSPGIFGSLFSHQSPLVFGRESVRYEAKGKAVKDSSSGTRADLWKRNENEDLCSIFKVHRSEPCNNIWSSIFYGGQDIFHVESTQNAGLPKNYENDDSGAASMGDWWKGGPYY